MKKTFKYLSSALMVAALGVTMTACDDWTEPESVDLNYGTIDKIDPATYAKYLENLRAYRATNHKKVYAWFENVAEFGSQGHRLSAVPDSVDVLVLTNPGEISPAVKAEIDQVRKDKGMELSYCIDYAAIKAEWTALCEDLAAKRLKYLEENGADAEIPAELIAPEFIDYVAKAWTTQLSYFKSGNFNSIMAAFDGKATNHLNAQELAEYMEQVNLFLGILADWHKRNPDVVIDFMGKPQYIAGHPLLNDFRMIFLFSMALSKAGNAVPASKLGIVTYGRSLDPDEASVGYFVTLDANGNKVLAVEALGAWGAANEVGAVGVMNTQNEYFFTNGSYSTVRNLIQGVNPSAK